MFDHTFKKLILMRNRNTFIDNFAQNHAFKNYIKLCETRKTLTKLDEYMKLVPVFHVFSFISPKFAHILKYFAQSCYCMIAAFRNSVFDHLIL